MSKTYKIRKGYDIKLVGEVEETLADSKLPTTFAVKPTDFEGLVPKLEVEVGTEVKAGTPLFHSKKNPDIFITSPVSGEVVEINRGEKRAILGVKILADSEMKYESFTTGNPSSMTRAAITENLMKSGVWPLIRQRPFSKIASPLDTPKAIFISGFDSSPLAPNYNFILKGKEKEFQTGLDALKKLTDGKVYLSLNGKANNCDAFTKAQGVEINFFNGPHPAGNVGVQIHHISPINKGDVVWFVNPQDVLVIGRLFLEGKYIAERWVALTGSEVNARKYHKLLIGASIENLVKDNVKPGNLRYISGNVLNGQKIEATGYLGYYSHQVTVIPEGEDQEFMGWLLPTYARPSFSKTFLSYLNPAKKYEVNTNMHGEERAFVVSGEYEKVLPMDIYPVHLLKAIMAEDFEAMESLGIYEVAEEDFALCEFICTSKINVTEILRGGLELVEREG